MKSWIHLNKGQVPRQAHVSVPSGLKEEEIGRGGFQGRVAEMYRRNEPTGWTRVEGDFAPLDLDGQLIDASDATNVRGLPTRCFHNDDLTISVSRRSEPMPYWYRNADGDEIWFTHRGEGVVETEFGPLDFKAGDYIVLPKGVTFRVVPSTRDNYFLHIESARRSKPCGTHDARAAQSVRSDRARHPRADAVQGRRPQRIRSPRQTRGRVHVVLLRAPIRSTSWAGKAICSRSASTTSTFARW